jgi:hypothetical protein
MNILVGFVDLVRKYDTSEMKSFYFVLFTRKRLSIRFTRMAQILQKYGTRYRSVHPSIITHSKKCSNIIMSSECRINIPLHSSLHGSDWVYDRAIAAIPEKNRALEQVAQRSQSFHDTFVSPRCCSGSVNYSEPITLTESI